MGFQSSPEGLDGVMFLDALGCGEGEGSIPEGWSHVPESSLDVLLRLRIPLPGNIKEKSRCCSEKTRRCASMKRSREGYLPELISMWQREPCGGCVSEREANEVL